MAGGIIIVLGLKGALPIAEQGVGSGIHGGEIFVRGPVDDLCLGNGARKTPVTDEQKTMIRPIIEDFARTFGIDAEPLLASEYTRIAATSARPFANKYTWE
jgi:glutamate synthase domain-containing protein 3